MLAAKEARRRKLAALPFPEKVRVVVRLQQMAIPILRARGRNVRAWELEAPPASAPGARPVSSTGHPAA